MRRAGDGPHGRRLRALIVVLWRAGLRIHEALALTEPDLNHRRGSVLVRRGKGGRRREVGMDEWAWEQLEPWTAVRLALPVGPLRAPSGRARTGSRSDGLTPAARSLAEGFALLVRAARADRHGSGAVYAQLRRQLGAT